MTTDFSLHIQDRALSESEKVAQRQQKLLEWMTADLSDLFASSLDFEQVGKKNCENLIGSVEIPVGIAGPVRVNDQEMLLPLATTEGALVASVNRGAKAISVAGGCQVRVEKIGMSRAPVFACADGQSAENFKTWIQDHWSEIKQTCEETSEHLKLLSHQTWLRGRYVFVRFVFDTDEAMGMNMVTIALQYMWEKLGSQLKDVELIALSSNVCSDKKDAVINRLFGRGYWVHAEVVLPHSVISEVLKTTAEKLISTHTVKNLIGSNVAGSFSQNMQAGNATAALYLATGQDMAHVTESSQASTLIEEHPEGVYVAVSLPNIVIGTVGGGTWLPAQSQARRSILKDHSVTAEELAKAVGAAVLAGEISGIAALASHSLAKAHAKLGRASSGTE